MAHIHITLVGGQPAPVYQGIIAMNPDKVLLIYSEQTEKESDRISEEFSIETELVKIHPVDLMQIDSSIEKIKNKISDDDSLSINIGGGTKTWSVMFYNHFKSRDNTEIFYIDQNSTLWSFNDYSPKKLSFDMDAQFRLYGTTPKKYHRFDIYTEEDGEAVMQIRGLRKFNYIDFNRLTSEHDRSRSETYFSTNYGSSLEWFDDKEYYIMSLTNKFRQEKEEVLDSPNIKTLISNTGWFEYEVAKMLNEWNKTSDLILNCEFHAKSHSPKNEIDIIVNAGAKLLFVECKTQISNETDIDKFAAAVKNYGGMGSKALFVTDAPMRDKAKEKCLDNKIMHFSIMEHGGAVLAKKSLFNLLDNELFNINVK